MKREDAGLFCLLSAVFFAIVAGGHVQLDARPDTDGALGVLLTFVACLAAVWCVFTVIRSDDKRYPWLLYAAFSFALLVLFADVFTDVLAGLHANADIVLFMNSISLHGGAMFTTVRAFIALLVFGGLTYMVAKDRILQVPTVVYAGFITLLVAALGTSILVSEFRTVSLDVWLNWITYAAGLYLAVAVLGRKRGPRMLIEVVVLAAGIVALKGVYEYSLVRAIEPTYRIFADWNNPNALAGLLVTALPLALAVACISDGLKRIGAWTSATLIVVALALTQSLGGFLVAPIGVVALFIAMLSWKGGKAALPALVPLVAGAALVFLINLTTREPSGASNGPTTPVATAVSTNEQASSTAYRILLWKGAVQLIKEQPVGFGVGTYRFNSARSGLNEQTHLTHQTYLQIALEGGFIALIGIVGLGIAWTVRMFLGARSLDHERNMLRAGVFGAVVACAAIGFIESNLYYFGAGFLFFVLLGTGLQLAADGTSPESLPKSLRATIVVTCCVLPFGVALWAMYLENAKSSLLASLDTEDRTKILAAEDSLKAIAGQDGEAWYLLAWLYPQSPEERTALYEKSVALAPSTRHMRGLAQAQFDDDKPEDALQTLTRALEYDPNNPRTLAMRMRFEDESGATTDALETAKRIVAIEQTPYMQTRALAELVPTEPFEARLFLARNTDDTTEKARLLREAVDGYLRYKGVTVPKILQFDKDGLDFVGETKSVAEQKMALAREAADQLAAIYESLGQTQEAERARAAKGQLKIEP